MIPAADGLGEIVEQAVGALFRDIYKNDAAVAGQSLVGFADDTGQIVDVARGAVEEYRVVVAAAEVGLLGR